jgi:thioredoxin
MAAKTKVVGRKAAAKKTAKAATRAKAAPTKKPSTATGKVESVTDKTFAKAIARKDLPVLVDFSAKWCGPCQRLAEVLPDLAQTFAGKVHVMTVDVDANPRISSIFAAEGVPTLLLFRAGRVVGADVGFGSRQRTEAWLRAALTAKPASKGHPPTCCCCG